MISDLLVAFQPEHEFACVRWHGDHAHATRFLLGVVWVEEVPPQRYSGVTMVGGIDQNDAARERPQVALMADYAIAAYIARPDWLPNAA